MKRIALSCSLLILAVAVVVCLPAPIGATGVEGRSYSYTTFEDVPHTGCAQFAVGGTFLVDVDSIGYDGTWRERRFRRLSLFRAHVEHEGINYFAHGLMPRAGKIVGTSYQAIEGGWVVKFEADETGCTPVAP